MLKTKKVMLAIAAITLAAGLSGCGRDNYQGTYTGYEMKTAAAGTTGYGGSYANPTSMVTLTLSNNNDLATGTYQVTPSYGTGFNTGTTTPQTPGQFQASTEQSGSLTNVQLMRFDTFGGSACLYTGSLSSANKGQTINGTLSSPSTVSGGQMNMCPSIQLSLTRGN